MDYLDFLSVLIVLGAVVVLLNRYMGLKDSQARLKLELEMKKYKDYSQRNQRGHETRQNQRQQRTQAPGPAPGEEVEPIGEWVPELLEAFGIDPDVIFEEEMPDQVKVFLPFAKGYVKSQGGLEGIAKQLQDKNQDQGTPQFV
jgi:hypothetical protein